MSHLVRVKSTLFVRTRRRLLGTIDGLYASRARGRGFDLEDLRPYVVGDDVRDIDWKTTARVGEAHVRRHRTTRQRALVAVVDTASTMDALTCGGESKADIAVYALGVLGYLAVRHGDRVGLIHGDAGRSAHVRPRDGERHLERLLDLAHDAIRESTQGPDLAGLLDVAACQAPRNAVLVVISDDVDVDDRLAQALHRAARRHDTLWVGVADANPARVLHHGSVVDARLGRRVPRHLARDARLADEYDRYALRLHARLTTVLDEGQISRCRIATEADALPELLTMLRRRPVGR